MVIDSGNGVYNLLVRNVTVSDDAQYQCQVSPGPAAGSKPIRSSARLTVLGELLVRTESVGFRTTAGRRVSPVQKAVRHWRIRLALRRINNCGG